MAKVLGEEFVEDPRVFEGKKVPVTEFLASAMELQQTIGTRAIMAGTYLKDGKMAQYKKAKAGLVEEVKLFLVYREIADKLDKPSALVVNAFANSVRQSLKELNSTIIQHENYLANLLQLFEAIAEVIEKEQ